MHVTFDTGALIGLERRHQRISKLYADLRQRRILVAVPTAVVAEWWRGRTDARVRILGGLYVEPLDDLLARVTGEAMAAVPGASIVDAVVMTSAARRGGVVYTSDVEDLERLRSFFPAVRVLRA
jgi:predicted nucleic acid-binding protein